MGRAEDLFSELLRDGETAVDRLIAERQSENLWLDFKRAGADGRGSKLHDSDWKNLAKAISGFGNSEGGVILWGVDCRDDGTGRGDLPISKMPIEDPHRFVSWLEGAVSGCTIPAHSAVKHGAIDLDGRSGYVATLIPFSQFAPLQAVKPQGSLQYFIRAGSSFVPTPHAVLAGLFGRRPQPEIHPVFTATVVAEKLAHVTRLNIDTIVSPINGGMSVAHRIFANVIVNMPRGGESRVTVEPNPSSEEYWFVHKEPALTSMITDERFALAPQSLVRALRLQFSFGPPFTTPYTFRLIVGCDGAPLSVCEISVAPDELHRRYQNLTVLAVRQSPTLPKEALSALLGVPHELVISGAV